MGAGGVLDVHVHGADCVEAARQEKGGDAYCFQCAGSGLRVQSVQLLYTGQQLAYAGAFKTGRYACTGYELLP